MKTKQLRHSAEQVDELLDRVDNGTVYVATAEEIATLSGVRGNVQQQLDDKATHEDLAGYVQEGALADFVKADDLATVAKSVETAQKAADEAKQSASDASGAAEAVSGRVEVLERNEAGYVTRAVDDLRNYYVKSQLYNRDEVNALIGGLSTMKVEVVETLPAEGEENVIYLKPKAGGLYDEYFYTRGAWDVIGDTDIDLSGYYTKTEADGRFLQAHQDVSGKADKTALTAHVENGTVHITAQEREAWNGKSDFSGSYADLIGKPTIPSKVSDLTNDSGYVRLSEIGRQVVDSESSEISLSVAEGGTDYVYGTLERLTVASVNNGALATSFGFRSGDVATVVAMPTGVRWVQGGGLDTIEANAAYTIALCGGVGVVARLDEEEATA